ncbi:MAG: bifunctional metallophosphatase/5'-nucleotidase [Coprobacillus sp.]|nr:bifunctional metallophosphatase/5'-nucleotidase [Coprobacillus sp.]
MKGKKTLIALSLLLVTSLSGCITKVEPIKTPDHRDDTVFILYTGDVNCLDDENIGYEGLYSYKTSILKDNSNVYLIDTGDALQGDFCGAVTEGSYIIDLMNEVGYDLAVLGNHEFDYGMDALHDRINEAGFPYISCNITYTGESTNKLSEVAPYVVKEIGGMTFGFVGVTSPTAISKSTPAYFMEGGDIVYDFAAGNDGQDLYDAVQESVDACIDKDADYIILCSHLGDSEEYSPYSSIDVLNNTYGIDICLDSQCSAPIDAGRVKDLDGNNVMLCSSGDGLEYIGQLEITPEGKVTHTLVSKEDIDYVTSRVTTKINEFNEEYEEITSEVLGYSYYDLTIEDEDGVRMTRNRETNLGDLVADAYRSVGEADIGLYNGGAIESSIGRGEITLGDAIDALPYLDTMYVSTVTGQDILNALELSVMYVEEEYRTYDFVTTPNPETPDEEGNDGDGNDGGDNDDGGDEANQGGVSTFADDDEPSSGTCTCPSCVEGCECECEGECDGECECECECSTEEDEPEYVPTPNSDTPIGEFGGFLQVSGITFDVDTSVESPVVLDTNGLFVEINGEAQRRVSNVYVGEDALCPYTTYTVASIDYLLRDSGNGYTMFDSDKITKTTGLFCYEVLAEFISSFPTTPNYDDNGGDSIFGTLPIVPEQYQSAQGRINITTTASSPE